MNWIVPETTKLYYCNVIKHNGSYAITGNPDMRNKVSGKKQELCITNIPTYKKAIEILQQVKVPNPKKRKRTK